VEGGVNAALVVACVAFVMLLVMLINLGLRRARRDPLVVALPATLYSCLAGVASTGHGA